MVWTRLSAYALLDVEAEQTLAARGQPHLPGDHPVLLPLPVMGDDLLVEEGADRTTERGMVLLEQVPPDLGHDYPTHSFS